MEYKNSVPGDYCGERVEGSPCLYGKKQIIIKLISVKVAITGWTVSQKKYKLSLCQRVLSWPIWKGFHLSRWENASTSYLRIESGLFSLTREQHVTENKISVFHERTNLFV